MRNVKWLLAAGLIAATAACTAETGPYGSSSYGYPSTAYNNGGYYSNGVYYSNNTAYNRGYYAPAPASNAYYASTPRRGPNGDYDRDGIPNQYDRDANGDGVPDRYQR
jgi:hypothetical protein